MAVMEAELGTEYRKVVVNLGDGRVLRGLMKTARITGLDALLELSSRKFPQTITLETDNGPLEVLLKDSKAVFFVKSFEGDLERHGLRFYTHGPVIRGIWVEIQFKDNEVIEGIIENSINHIVDEGFLLSPSDPESNNILIYVNKSAMKHYRVLGVRMIE
jgi:hypothetical protein